MSVVQLFYLLHLHLYIAFSRKYKRRVHVLRFNTASNRLHFIHFPTPPTDAQTAATHHLERFVIDVTH